jgi:hypothetical protein
MCILDLPGLGRNLRKDDCAKTKSAHWNPAQLARNDHKNFGRRQWLDDFDREP